MQDIRGTLGTSVYSIYKAGVHYIRTQAADPADPDTELQRLMRDAKAAALGAYAVLSVANKALWEEYAQQFANRNQDLNVGGGTTNLIPHHRPPLSGQTAFVQAYLRLARCYGSPHDTPPTGKAPCCLQDLTVGLGYAQESIEIDWSEPDDCGCALTEYLDENFELEIVGQTPNQWTPAWNYIQPGTAKIECTAIKARFGSKSGRCTTGSGIAQADFNIPALATQDSITLDYWFNVNDATPLTYAVQIRNTPAAGSSILATIRAEFFRYYVAGVEQQGPAVADNVWYHVKYVLHPGTRTFEFYFTDMITPFATGQAYHTPNDSFFIVLRTSASMIYFDDIRVYHDTCDVRVWLLSYAAGAHKQLVGCVGISAGGILIERARYAGGAFDLLVNNPGLYYIQLDVLAKDQVHNGLLSVPSEIFRITIP